MALVTTVGGSDSNSYVDVAFADNYLLGHSMHSVWAALSPEEKEAALIRAARTIDLLHFVGTKKSQAAVGDPTYQAMQWPRYCPSSDGYMLDIPYLRTSHEYVEWIDNTGNPIVPMQVKNAQCEQAIFYLAYGKEIEAARFRARTGLSERTTGKLSEKYSYDIYTDLSALSSIASDFLFSINCIDDSLRVDRA